MTPDLKTATFVSANVSSECGDAVPAPVLWSRRRALKSGCAVAGVMAPMVNFGRYNLFAASDRAYSAKAVELIGRSLVIDMLSIMGDLGDILTARYSKSSKLLDGMAITDEHLVKLRSAGVHVYHPAMGLGGREDALAFVARLNAYAANRPDLFQRIDTVTDMEKAKAGNKIGYIVGIQNAQHFNTLDDVNEFYHLGQRVSQLTYNTQTRIGTGSTDRVDGGISDFGAGIVQRMNEIGMAIDVSHCGDNTTLDAFGLSKAPVLITHSNARALVNGHPRCKSDEAIRKMAKSGGVMGITGVRNFVRDKEPTTIEHLLDHFDYVAKLVGVEHIGIGSDMDADGYDDLPEDVYERLKSGYKNSYGFRGKIDIEDFDHPQRVFDLTEGLIRRGYTDADIELVLGGNFKRVLDEIWKA